MERVLYMAQDDRRHTGKNAKEIVEKKWLDRPNFIGAKNVDRYVQLVIKRVLGKKKLPSLQSLGRTTEQRCEYLLKLLTKLKMAAVIKQGSKTDKDLYSLLRRKKTFVARDQIYTPPK